MLPVEIFPVQDSVVLRARGSELLILPHHVRRLKELTQTREFSVYFRDEALVNRPARKLFEAWLRKDQTLWPRLYKLVHKELTLSPEDKDPEDSPLGSEVPAISSATQESPKKVTKEAAAPLNATQESSAEASEDAGEQDSSAAKKPTRKATTKKAAEEETSAKPKTAKTKTKAASVKDEAKTQDDDAKAPAKKSGESKSSKTAPKKSGSTTKDKSATVSDTTKRSKKGTKA